jgi:hypothetical protein
MLSFIMLRLIFNFEDGGDKCIRNIGWISRAVTVLFPEERTIHDRCCENLKP